MSAEILKSLPTPCLVIDVEAADRNIARAAKFYASRAVKLRPHFKAHKCSRLLRRQVDAGGCVGVTCATPWEAEVLARAGFNDILVANQVISPPGLQALARAAAEARITVVVDSATHVGALQACADHNEVNFGVLIEIDVGMGRCGLNLGSDQLLPLAAATANSARLRFLGLQGYEGHAVMKEDRALRQLNVWQVAQVLRTERARLEDAGYPCPVVSGGGTGTWDLAADTGVWTDIQAGSYVLMDARYASLDLPFENALYCAATVISRRAPDAGVLNVGLKGLTVEYGMPTVVGRGIRVLALSDEHARISVQAGTQVEIGDTVLIIPAHIDPAINLHDTLFAWEERQGISFWPVDGRRRLA